MITHLAILFHFIAGCWYLFHLYKLRKQKPVDINALLIKQMKLTSRLTLAEVNRWTHYTAQWATGDDVSKRDIVDVLNKAATDTEMKCREYEGEEILETIRL